jgi:hypothetical protein
MKNPLMYCFISFLCCCLVACAGTLQKKADISHGKQETAKSKTTKPAAALKSGKTPPGLLMTNIGIDFDNTHPCTGTYQSESSDMEYNSARQLIGYKIETSCTTNKETHIQKFSDIAYNQLNQRESYNLQLSCSRTGETHQITVSQISYDDNWDVLSYVAVIDGETYFFER